MKVGKYWWDKTQFSKCQHHQTQSKILGQPEAECWKEKDGWYGFSRPGGILHGPFETRDEIMETLE